MKISDLKNILKATGYPVAYSHFGKKVSPPYIAYLQTNTEPIVADNAALLQIISIDVELYTSKKDTTAEGKVEKVLNDAGILWEKSEDYIGKDKLFMNTYEIEIEDGD